MNLGAWVSGPIGEVFWKTAEDSIDIIELHSPYYHTPIR